jgi:hypothetical protein
MAGVTWLPVPADGRAERDAVLGLTSEPYDVMRRVLLAAWNMTEPGLLEICRLRLAQLTGARAELDGADEDLLAALDDWRSSDRLTERERIVLDYAEQYHYDHHTLSDAQREALAGELSRLEVIDFTWALHMNDAYIRVMSLLDIAPDPPGSPPRIERAPPTRPRERPPSPVAEREGVRARELRDADFTAVLNELNPVVVRQDLVDPATSEAIRLRNASYQGCVY